jgi:hypothetical protein
MCNTQYFCQILMKLEFYQQIFEKYSNRVFNENPSSGIRIVACLWIYGKTDEEANSRFSKFCESA